MSSAMTTAARQQFLADLHVGVLSVAIPDGAGSIAVPIWYDYAPERGVRVITSHLSPKARAMETTGRYALVAQDEARPYRYVSVEGPITEVRRVDPEGDLLPLAIRYLGVELGTRYAEGWAAGDNGADRLYTMRPQHWASADMTAAFADLQATA